MKIRTWEERLLLALLAVILMCAAPLCDQQVLAGKITRLHVLANSDDPRDQQLKLQVRDAVLEVSEGVAVIDQNLLAEIHSAAQRTVQAAGYSYEVQVSRERCFFDTRQYETFSLPAGYYDAVRVVIGKGAGQNWWCVMYPPLCSGVCEEELTEIALQAGLNSEEIFFICEEKGYVLRFQMADLWGKLVHKIREAKT